MSQDNTDFSGYSGWTWIVLVILDGIFLNFSITIMLIKIVVGLMSVGWTFLSWFWF